MSLGDLKVDGFKLQYRIEGEGWPAIVIGSHLYYPRTFSKDLRKHLKLIFVDQRAFCLQHESVKDDFELSKLLSDIELLRQTLNLGKVILIGHSIHAFMAMEYALKYPEAVSKLVLIAASPSAGRDIFQAADTYFSESVCPERKAALEKNMQAASISADGFIQRMLTFAPMIWYDFNYDAQHLWQDVNVNPTGASIVWGEMFDQYRIQGPITIPVFLGLGRYDYWNPPHLWESERKHFTDLTIRVFERSGHTPQLEESVSFNDELLSWINNHHKHVEAY